MTKARKVPAIKDNRIDKLVRVSSASTSHESIKKRATVWNRRVARVLGDESNPYVFVEVKEGTKAACGIDSRPECAEGLVPVKKKATKKKAPAKKNKKVEADEKTKPIEEWTGPMRCGCGHMTDNPKGNKCGYKIGFRFSNDQYVDILCEDTTRKNG